MFDHWTLSNGLHVVGERLPYLRSVSIGVWLRVASMMEQAIREVRHAGA